MLGTTIGRSVSFELVVDVWCCMGYLHTLLGRCGQGATKTLGMIQIKQQDPSSLSSPPVEDKLLYKFTQAIFSMRLYPLSSSSPSSSQAHQLKTKFTQAIFDAMYLPEVWMLPLSGNCAMASRTIARVPASRIGLKLQGRSASFARALKYPCAALVQLQPRQNHTDGAALAGGGTDLVAAPDYVDQCDVVCPDSINIYIVGADYINVSFAAHLFLCRLRGL